MLTALVYGADCPCDVALVETMKLRQCSLCKEAEKHGDESEIFFLKDINPRKPNRWLALPRRHSSAMHELAESDPKLRLRLWTAAIEKAKSLWGDEWGIAYNGSQVRTQCHAHVHIGKLLKGIETDRFVVIQKPSQIPLAVGEGIWLHPAGRKYHVHLGEQTTETVLLR
ncbi:MAG: hypothetical protein WKF37_11390 [Bryobacteraceae bacterium]